MAEEIRPLQSEAELDQRYDMTSQAFREPLARMRRWRAGAHPADFRGVFIDGGLCATLNLIPMPTWFGTAPVPCVGLSGVATPPEYRRQGLIGRLLRATLEEMRANGVPLSTLYPFSYPFYKHYGWEHVVDSIVYTMPTTALPLADAGGSWHVVQRSTDLAGPEARRADDATLAIPRALYDAWCPGRHGPITRDPGWWRSDILRELDDQRPDAYYWRDPSGTPRAYLTYRLQELETRWHRRLEVEDWVALDAAALRALLGFVRNHESQAQEVHWRVGLDDPLHALLDNPEGTIRLEPGLMLRIVDVAGALAARRWPLARNGDLTFHVTDRLLPANTGTYRLAVAEGHAEVDRTAATPGLRLDERALARLYSGYLTAGQLATLGLIEVADAGALETAGHLFAGPRPWLADDF